MDIRDEQNKRRRDYWAATCRVTEPAPNVSATLAIAELVAFAATIDDELAGWVAVARAEGYSWQAISNALGITRQAAHARYAGSPLP